MNDEDPQRATGAIMYWEEDRRSDAGRNGAWVLRTSAVQWSAFSRSISGSTESASSEVCGLNTAMVSAISSAIDLH